MDLSNVQNPSLFRSFAIGVPSRKTESGALSRETSVKENGTARHTRATGK